MKPTEKRGWGSPEAHQHFRAGYRTSSYCRREWPSSRRVPRECRTIDAKRRPSWRDKRQPSPVHPEGQGGEDYGTSLVAMRRLQVKQVKKAARAQRESQGVTYTIPGHCVLL